MNESFEFQKDFIRNSLLLKIQNYFSEGLLTHYEWEPDSDEYWDDSGILIPDGYIDMNQTVSHFLEEEYNGEKTATFISGSGWSYDTYGYDLSDLLLEIGYSIMRGTIEDILQEQFPDIIITDESLLDLDCDCIYDESYTNLFYDWYFPVEFTGIGELTLNEVKNMPLSHIVKVK